MSQVVIRMLRDPDGQLRRVRIHWFVRTPEGAATTPGVGLSHGGQHPLMPGGKGYLACQKAKTTVTPELINGVWHPCPLTDDVRSATCPECLATPEAQAMLKTLEELVPIPNPVPKT